MDIGKKIKLLAKVRGLTQKQIASALGVTQQFISALYNDTKQPSLETIISLCNVLGVTPNVLLDIETTDNEIDDGLSQDEHALIKKYRTLNTREKIAVSTLIDSLADESIVADSVSAYQNGNDCTDDKYVG